MVSMRVKILFYSVMTFLLSCEERYFISLDPDVTDQLVINGFIDQSEGPYFIYVALTQGDWRPPLGIENAEVVIKDEAGQEESCAHMYEGKYSCAGDVVRGRLGVAYQIEVTYDNQLFTSSPDRMPLVEASSLMSWTEDQIITTSINGVDVMESSINFDLDVSVPIQKGFIFFNGDLKKPIKSEKPIFQILLEPFHLPATSQRRQVRSNLNYYFLMSSVVGRSP